MIEELTFAKKFCEDLLEQAKCKATLYDGVERANRKDNDMSVDFFLRYAIEELGEVSSAITRKRWFLAKAECVDVAHTALLIALALQRKIGD